ncbi:MAG: hypothetical protein JWO82_2508 [Akkermansiaceae bacterium]|nr:hypothetical protein [Akkermansiaceae bacterium]
MPGQWDCVLFIAAWADLVTGSDHLGHYRGLYATHFGGLRIAGPEGICGAVRRTLRGAGWSEVVDPAEFRPGDVVLTTLDHPGIWAGDCIASAARGAAGHTFLHPSQARSALHPPEL